MKVVLKLEKLKQSLDYLSGVSTKNLSLPVLTTILISAKGREVILRATNLQVGVEVKLTGEIENPGACAVDASILQRLFSSLSSVGDVYLEIYGTELRIKTTNNSFSLKTSPHEDFPTLSRAVGDTFTVNQKVLEAGIKSVSYAASISDIKPEISSVYIYSDEEYLIFVSTDSFRLAEKKIKIKGLADFPGVLIPYKNISELLRIISHIPGDIDFTISEHQISLRSDNIFCTSRVIDGNFPDYKQIIPGKLATEVVCLKSDLVDILKVTNLFSDRFQRLQIVVDIKSSSCSFNSSNQDIGKGEAILESTIEGESTIINVNHRYLNECLNTIKEDSIVLEIENNRPVKVYGVGQRDFLYLVMPMNL